MHETLPFLLALLALLALIVILNLWAKHLKIAYPILLVLAGLTISFIPGLPSVHINPDLIFFIFLPPLLFDAAWQISFKEMKKWWRMIGSFAFLVVFFTAFTVAIVTHNLIPGFTLAFGLLLGGIVSPPDAVSTAAITRFVKIPKVLSTILEGESLMNDASSLIIFRFAILSIITGQFVIADASISFAWMILGGAGIGLLLGWLFVKIHQILPTDAPSDIVLTIIEPYFMYWVAEQAHSSGVLAVVFGGLYMSTKRLLFLNCTSRIRGFSVWESFTFMLNGIVFLIIGLELPEIIDGIREKGIDISTAIFYGVIVTIVLVIVRIISSYSALIATLIFRPKVLPKARTTKRRFLMPLLLGWTGMRGVVSLAAALAIPIKLDDGTDFPHRNLILFITFVVILLTLTIQGLTLPYIIRKSKIFDDFIEDEDESGSKKMMKLALRSHVYQFFKTKHETGDYGDSHIHIERLMRYWEERAEDDAESWITDEIKQVLIEMFDSQRQFLEELNNDPTINEEIIRHQLFQIDLEEERLKML
jgi:CPA1 family monovalent cation:H+ antiporter